MTMRHRLFTIGRTEVYLHLATVLYAAYMLLLHQGAVLVVSLVSILVHEAAHGLVASWFKNPPQEMEISPLGAMLRLDDDTSLSVNKRLLMLLAGPAASFLMCWVAVWLTGGSWLSQEQGKLLFATNLLLLVGNLLPALPMDGGRVMALLLSLRFRPDTVRQVMRVIGTCIGMAFIALNLFLSLCHGGWNLSMAMTGCFLMYAASTCTTSAVLAELRMFMDRKIRLECKGVLPCRWTAITEQFPLRRAVKLLSPRVYVMFVCVDPVGIKPAWAVGETAMIAAYLNDPSADFCSVEKVQSLLQPQLFH